MGFTQIFFLTKFEADRRSINITINSFGTELSKDDRQKLYPSVGYLFPEGIAKLGKCDDVEQVRVAIEQYAVINSNSFLYLFLRHIKIFFSFSNIVIFSKK